MRGDVRGFVIVGILVCLSVVVGVSYFFFSFFVKV